MKRGRVVVIMLLAISGCSKKSEPKPTPRAKIETPQPAAPTKVSIPAPSDVVAPPVDAERLENGLASKVLMRGHGTSHPNKDSVVTIHYTGWTTDGKMFDSSVLLNAPVTVSLESVIAGWRHGIQRMVQGEKRRLWIPEALAYRGEAGSPAGTLVFEIELLGFKDAPKPVAAPKDVAAPPRDADTTASGLVYKILSSGSGTKKPGPSSLVKMHYTGWTTDGTMFDSSASRGSPMIFPIEGVVPGWGEGLQLLHVGDKARLWIPEKLAYQGRPGRPRGMLVIDVELIEVLD